MQRGRGLLVERLGRGLGRQPEALGEQRELVVGVGRLVARLLRAHLGGGHAARRARAAGAGSRASSPAQARSRAARSSPAARSAASSASSASTRAPIARTTAVERRGEPRGARLERAIGGDPVAQAGDPARALGALALGALGDAALGGQLAVDLRAAHGGRAFQRRLAALGDEPRRAARVLLGAGERARPVAAGAVGLLARGVGGAHGLLGELARPPSRASSARDGRVARGDELLAAVALGEHALLAALGRLAQLAVAAVPDAAVAGRGDAVEARRQVADVLDDPGVPQQAPRDGEVVRLALDEVADVPRARAPAGASRAPARARGRR